MRTILFRGYIKYPSDIINGFWYGDLIHYANGDIYIRQVETGMEHEVIPESVGQFTGIVDKNGTRIFENDILTYTVSCGSTDGMVRKNKDMHVFHALAIFEDGVFRACKINGDGSRTKAFTLSCFTRETIEGNTSELPEVCFLK